MCAAELLASHGLHLRAPAGGRDGHDGGGGRLHGGLRRQDAAGAHPACRAARLKHGSTAALLEGAPSHSMHPAPVQAGGLDALSANPKLLKEAVVFASAAGAVTCTRPGAIEAQPTRELVEALYESSRAWYRFWADGEGPA